MYPEVSMSTAAAQGMDLLLEQRYGIDPDRLANAVALVEKSSVDTEDLVSDVISAEEFINRAHNLSTNHNE